MIIPGFPNVPFPDLKRRLLSRGDFLLQAGSLQRSLWLVHSGIIRHFHVINGQEITRWIALPGSFTTSLRTFFYGWPADESLEVIADADVSELTHEGWSAWVDKHPVVKDYLIDVLLKDCIGYEDRIAGLIGKSATERYLSLMEQHPDWIRQVPLEYLDQLIGTTPRHLSRIRRELVRNRR